MSQLLVCRAVHPLFPSCPQAHFHWRAFLCPTANAQQKVNNAYYFSSQHKYHSNSNDIYCVPSPIPCSVCALSHFLLTATLGGEEQSHFTMRRLRHRQLKSLDRGHLLSKWRSQEVNSNLDSCHCSRRVNRWIHSLWND